MDPEARLAELQIQLPEVAKPVASYVPCVLTGNLLYVSGQLPTVAGKLVHEGLVGRDVNVAQGQECARTATVNALAVIRGELGRL